MSYCCVPLCKSDEKKKTVGLSFHEIPAVGDVRVKWLAAIRRDNWAPNATSCYTKVCSRHFKADDFLEGKRRCLKKRVIPSVIEDYPSHLQLKRSSERSTASIAKQSCAPTRLFENDSATGTPWLQPPAKPTARNPEVQDVEPMDTTASAGEATEQQHAPNGNETPPKAATGDKVVQVDSRSTSSLLATERAKCKRKERLEKPDSKVTADCRQVQGRVKETPGGFHDCRHLLHQRKSH